MPGTASINIEVHGDVKRLKRALRVLAEGDAPYLREALEQGGHDLEGAVESRATGRLSGTVQFAGVKGKANTLRALVLVRHEAAKVREFGRNFFYRGYTGRAQKATGNRFRSNRGIPPKPFVGIVKGDHAIGAVAPRIRQRLETAIDREWTRLGGKGA